MSSRLHPPSGPPVRPWRVVARVAALAAIVTLGLHPSPQFVAAGLMAAGAAIAAHAEACFRAGRGRSSDLADVLAEALALAFVMLCLLGLAAGIRPR